jgi:hypothetical protein
MPTVRLVNPKRSRVRRAGAKRLRRGRNGRFKKRKRGRNPAAGGGELLIMNPKRRRVRHHHAARHRRRNYRRRRNPVSYAVARPVRRRRRHHAMSYNPMRRRRRHNPLGFTTREVFSTALWAIAGGVGTRAIPQLFLKDSNTGFMGYIANGVTAGALGWIGDRWISPTAGKGIFLGGMVMLGGRIIADLFGKTLVSFGDVFGTTGTSGLGAHGDPSFDLGLYTPNEFVVPTWSDGVYQRQDYPFLEPSSALTAPSQSVRAQIMSPAVATPAGPVKPGISGLGFPATGRLRSRFAA